MYSNILVPFDGSEGARHAIEAAANLTTHVESAVVTVLQVVDSKDFDSALLEGGAHAADLDSISQAQVDNLQRDNDEIRRERVRKLVERDFDGLPGDIDLRIVVEHGSPRDAIVRYAEGNDIDCIVMGHRGISGIHAALGSVSSAVLRGIDLPVLFVK